MKEIKKIWRVPLKAHQRIERNIYLSFWALLNKLDYLTFYEIKLRRFKIEQVSNYFWGIE